MSRTKKDPIPIADRARSWNDQDSSDDYQFWEQFGPTLRVPTMLKATSLGRSSFYKVKKEDPTFPKGKPLFKSERSPRFWMTHEVRAWVKSRPE